VLSLHAATYAGGKEEEAATMALMQSGAVDAVAGALTASIMNERVVQHDLQAVVPFVTREADRAVTPRWVQLSAQCPGARTWWRAGGLQGCRVAGLQGCRVAGLQGCRVAGLQGCRVAGWQGCRVAGLQGCRVAGLQGWRVGGLVEVAMVCVLALGRWVHRKRGSKCMIR
jgi:hypothetical protein